MLLSVHKATEDEIKSSDGWSIWEKEVSEFDWSYSDKETCYILEGEAEVVSDDGESIKFTVGDWVVFEPGLKCVWKITSPIKKRYLFG